MAIEVYSLTVAGHVMDQPMTSILHFVGTGMTADLTYETGTNLVTLFDADFLAEWLAICPNSYDLDYLRARRVKPKQSAEAFKQYQSNSQSGTFSSDAVSTELRPSMFLVPVLGTKSGGRIFLPSAPDDSIAANLYQGAYVTACNTLMTNLTTNHVSGGITWTLCVFSRKLNSYSDVSAWHLSARLGFQKRSKRFVT